MKYLLLILLVIVTTHRVAAITNYERHIIASCLVLEAASEGDEGMRAVLNVIWNRSDQRLERVFPVVIKPWQFSCMRSIWMPNPDYTQIIRRAQRDRTYASALKLVLVMEKRLLQDNTNGATFYHTTNITPYWSSHFKHEVTIRNHIFYSDKK